MSPGLLSKPVRPYLSSTSGKTLIANKVTFSGSRGVHSSVHCLGWVVGEPQVKSEVLTALEEVDVFSHPPWQLDWSCSSLSPDLWGTNSSCFPVSWDHWIWEDTVLFSISSSNCMQIHKLRLCFPHFCVLTTINLGQSQPVIPLFTNPAFTEESLLSRHCVRHKESIVRCVVTTVCGTSTNCPSLKHALDIGLTMNWQEIQG